MLYLQIHPVKRATNFLITIPAVYFFWIHEFILGVVVLLPAAAATALVLAFADLEKVRDSRLGRYVKKYMTRSMQAARGIGALLLFAGAWFQNPEVMLLAIVIVIIAWSRGILSPSPQKRGHVAG